VPRAARQLACMYLADAEREDAAQLAERPAALLSPGVERSLNQREVALRGRISIHDLLAPQRLHDVGREQERVLADLAEKERAGHAAESAPVLAELVPEADQVLGGPSTEETPEAAVGGRHPYHPGGVLAHALDLRTVADCAWITDQIVDVAVAEVPDELGIEAGERLFHRRPLVLDD